MFGLLDRDIIIIREVMNAFPQISEAVIFGSRAMGNYKIGSDVDIAVIGNEITRDIIIRLSGILNEEKGTPYFFDILDYNKINNDELKKHIDENGKVIYDRKVV